MWHACFHTFDGGSMFPMGTLRSGQGLAPLSEQEVDELLLFADPEAW